ERTRPRAMTRVLISYAAEDRMWAEWIAGVLGKVGLATELSDIAATSSADAPADAARAELVAVLLSSFYRLRPETTSWLSRDTQPQAGRRRWSVLPISVDGTALPEELEGLAMVDLSGMGPERARLALLTALNWPAGDTEAAEEGGSVQPRFPTTPPRISRV